MEGHAATAVSYTHLDVYKRQAQPYVMLTSRVQTQNRSGNWAQQQLTTEDETSLKAHLAPTALLPTDGIVRTTALQATQGAHTDVEKAQWLYDWFIANTYREPKIRGCGEGDIKTMLELSLIHI